MAYTENDPALAMFQDIIQFDEMRYYQFPDRETANERRENLKDIRRHLILDAVQRGSYDLYLTKLDDYKRAFQEIYTRHKETFQSSSIPTVYQLCITTLKLLTGRFRMRMLLHDLQQIHEDLM
jgi:hypothetical protein